MSFFLALLIKEFVSAANPQTIFGLKFFKFDIDFKISSNQLSWLYVE